MDVYSVEKSNVKLMLSLDNRSYSFSAALQSCFSKSTYFIPVQLYITDDRFDKFPLIADKIRARSTDEGFVVQSSYEVIKRCLYGDL